VIATRSGSTGSSGRCAGVERALERSFDFRRDAIRRLLDGAGACDVA
jgi:hypothetical protein